MLFNINIGPCGESEVEVGITNREARLIARAQRHYVSLDESKKLKSLFRRVDDAAYDQIKADLEINNELGLAPDEVSYSVSFGETLDTPDITMQDLVDKVSALEMGILDGSIQFDSDAQDMVIEELNPAEALNTIFMPVYVDHVGRKKPNLKKLHAAHKALKTLQDARHIEGMDTLIEDLGDYIDLLDENF